jgi:hypothetical protein
MTMPLYPTDQELDAMYVQGIQVSHYAGLRVVFQAALDAATSVTDPNAAANAVLQAAPTQDTTDLSTAPVPTA